MTTPFDPKSLASASREDLLTLIGALFERLEAAEARIKELEDRLAKDSHNSGKPPSSDGLAKKPAPLSLRQKRGRPSGGQPGHRGSTLRMSETPDHLVFHSPVACAACGFGLDHAPSLEGERRQVFDLPPTRLEVTEHRSECKSCPCCGTLNKGVFPRGVTQPAQYGDRIKAVGVYLTSYQLLPLERSTQILSDLFGGSLSEGVLQAAQQSCSQTLAPIVEQLKEALRREKIVHFDETGQRIAGKLHWLHSAGTKALTYYATHAKRGHEATDDIGILPAFEGRAIHDAWSSYWNYDCKHGLCNAHHLRELIFVAEQYDQDWARRMKTLLLDIKNDVDLLKSQGATELGLLPLRAFEHGYNRLIEQGYNANPEVPRTLRRRGRTQQTKGHNLVARLDRYRDQTLAFMYDFSVPFDNNLAERDIRMMKVRQKVSGCFRTREGAETFCVIRGYISTMRKQGHNVLDVLETVFQARPRAPVF